VPDISSGILYSSGDVSLSLSLGVSLSFADLCFWAFDVWMLRQQAPGGVLMGLDATS
jgi:hypothetical protein